ncbi:anti-sigma factor domain-containing protein [Caldibacillus thermoamylovorans]|uniref:anti-sigma factor domain-containing protein n=1 Tax=Geobacillus vulcani TaxID=135517 RepID=UPI0004DF6E9B|nr:anti-sigma factor [Geobacillus vulcani]
MKHSHISETKIVDWLLDRLPEREKEDVSSHLKQCLECQRLLEAWKGIGLKAEAHYEAPPLSRPERIWAQAEAQKQTKRMRRGLRLAGGWIGAAVAVFLFTLRLSAPNDGPAASHDRSDEPYRYMIVEQKADIPIERIIHNPETKQIPIEPSALFQQLDGTIWLNDDTKEMLMELEGLPPFTARDYQLWIIYTNNEVKGELLTVRHGTARILITGEDVKRFKQIKASLEPKGGSATPTGPETFIVDLKHE